MDNIKVRTLVMRMSVFIKVAQHSRQRSAMLELGKNNLRLFDFIYYIVIVCVTER
jgi:hypothetical protein